MSYAQFLICSFSTVEFGELFVCFRYKSVVGYMICKHFISVHLLSLHSASKSFVKLKLILMRPNSAVFSYILPSPIWVLCFPIVELVLHIVNMFSSLRLVFYDYLVFLNID